MGMYLLLCRSEALGVYKQLMPSSDIHDVRQALKPGLPYRILELGCDRETQHDGG